MKKLSLAVLTLCLIFELFLILLIVHPDLTEKNLRYSSRIYEPSTEEVFQTIVNSNKLSMEEKRFVIYSYTSAYNTANETINLVRKVEKNRTEPKHSNLGGLIK